MTTPENRINKNPSAASPKKRPSLSEWLMQKRITNNPLADGQDNQGLYHLDIDGRRWYHVDHVDGNSGKIIFYRNKERSSVISYEEEVRNRRARKLVAEKIAEEKGIGIKKEGLGIVVPAGLNTAAELPASNGLQKPHGKRVSHGGRHIGPRKK